MGSPTESVACTTVADLERDGFLKRYLQRKHREGRLGRALLTAEGVSLALALTQAYSHARASRPVAHEEEPLQQAAE